MTVRGESSFPGRAGALPPTGADALAALVRRRRRELGLSQEQLAERAGVSVRALRDLERGCVARPRPSTTARLAEALDLPADERARITGASRPRPPVEPVRCLPADLVTLVGRDEELRSVLAVAAGDGRAHRRPVLVHGPAGAGTTTLLVRAAHRLAATVPAPVIHLDVRDLADAGDVARAVLAALGEPPAATGVGPEPAPTPSAALARLGGGVVVIDGVRSEDQVAGLLDLPGPTVLLGSRGPLPGLAGVRRVPLYPLGPAASGELLAAAVGRVRVDAEPEAVAALLARCDGWPLALSLIAARIAARPDWPLAEVAARVVGGASSVARVRAGDVSVCDVLDAAARGQPREALVALRDGSVAGSPWATVLVACGVVWPDGAVTGLVRDWAATRP